MVEESLTLSQIMAKLQQKGFLSDFKAEGGKLILLPDHIAIAPESVEVHALHRLEGETDLDEETIVFALYVPSMNARGIYVAAFGPKMTEEDIRVIQKLREKKPPSPPP